ncbi:undecaprenyldiphospho-muramoylpentapeptide beta-N-acetylglucosaminyltransferase [Oceanimonas baumannii]|uniref:UDP-N-acetylglucosamine--N-acetylmuramyl-(pentapeptide) pyrophosphoryl-undecaprenol N-acetylglucosamine transferase n=1 Tax=Oceanimonas baumannii TaxID=129578 RepID=A0A235CJK2_9GAMM|nr:undecaprenyldiphospho-muramoylpentapeptide beta-N-acetylglucosaminyltransferase [Oceanimonas baumannii]OYD24609.1 undecaprenyldiphospho-muramoylpentapeptide beta-N-acetylglucosaminyltransferase [Oceanimonas baumannii]TDW59346.1 UDP-N-acetylglucosamine-N-acetylmuramylpentapeptide N-acetylglucosamine transferase [Oceanimonas baumannii]
MSHNKTLLVMAGGTGGHVFPGLAVADLLRQEGWTIHWLGTADRMEARLVPEHGYPLHTISIAGVRGNGVKRLLAAPFKIANAVFQARRVLKQTRPDVVLGMGGFAAGPGGVAARLAGIPLVLHEQNAAAGMTNRLLSRIASRVLMAFPGAFEQGDVVGNPVRPDVVALPAPAERISLEPQPLRLLVVGGSLGAKVLNDTLPDALAQVNVPVQVRHQCGKGNRESVHAAYAAQGVQAEVSDFITDMAAAYGDADLVVCRAGALTVSEVAAAGIGAIFVPLPHAVDDHQTKNARALVDEGAALLMPQSELTSAALALQLEQLAGSRERLRDMAGKARQLAITDAAAQVANCLRALTT